MASRFPCTPKQLPMYAYQWKGEGALFTVYSEEGKKSVIQDMIDDGALEEYTWYRLTPVETRTETSLDD